MTLIAAASRMAPDRICVAGVLAVRCLRYLNQSAGPGAAIAGLTVRSRRSAEVPIFHASTGLYGFLRLPPGTHRLYVTDAAQRFLPQAVSVTVEDRGGVTEILERGGLPAPGASQARFFDIAMRPAVGHALPPGETSIWGQVSHADGRPAAFARLQLATRHEDADTQVLSYADARGVYLLRLAGERARFVAPEDVDGDGAPDSAGELTQSFERNLAVHRLRIDPLGMSDPLEGFPADFETLDPNAPAGPYRPVSFRLHDPAGGELREPSGPIMPQPTVRVGRRIRWDIVLD